MNKRKNIISLLATIGVLATLYVDTNNHKEMQEQITHITKEYRQDEKEIRAKNEEIDEIKKQLSETKQELVRTEKQLDSQMDKNKEIESKLQMSVSRGISSRNVRNVGEKFVATGYTNRPEENGWGAITKSGMSISNKDINDKIIAVDSNVIPLGSKVYIQFDSPYQYLSGEYRAEDTGSAIKGNKIDIMFGGDVNSAMDFGRRNVTVKYIKEGK